MSIYKNKKWCAKEKKYKEFLCPQTCIFNKNNKCSYQKWNPGLKQEKRNDK
jgi:hypothetical protein